MISEGEQQTLEVKIRVGEPFGQHGGLQFGIYLAVRGSSQKLLKQFDVGMVSWESDENPPRADYHLSGYFEDLEADLTHRCFG